MWRGPTLSEVEGAPARVLAVALLFGHAQNSSVSTAGDRLILNVRRGYPILAFKPTLTYCFLLFQIHMLYVFNRMPQKALSQPLEFLHRIGSKEPQARKAAAFV